MVLDGTRQQPGVPGGFDQRCLGPLPEVEGVSTAAECSGAAQSPNAIASVARSMRMVAESFLIATTTPLPITEGTAAASSTAAAKACFRRCPALAEPFRRKSVTRWPTWI